MFTRDCQMRMTSDKREVAAGPTSLGIIKIDIIFDPPQMLETLASTSLEASFLQVLCSGDLGDPRWERGASFAANDPTKDVALKPT